MYGYCDSCSLCFFMLHANALFLEHNMNVVMQ